MDRHLRAVVLDDPYAGLRVSRGVLLGLVQRPAHSGLVPLDVGRERFLGVIGRFPQLPRQQAEIVRGENVSVGKIAVHVSVERR